MTVREIVKDYLKNNNYDGLCCIEGFGAVPCGCGVDDLFPCVSLADGWGDNIPNCQPAKYNSSTGLYELAEATEQL